MQPASGANKDVPVLDANHWGGGQSSIWRATRRIGLAARRRFRTRSSASLVGLELGRLWKVAHIGSVAAVDTGASSAKGATGAEPGLGRGRTLVRTSLTDLVFPLLLVGATSLVLAVAARYTSFELHSTLYLIPVIISAVRWGIRSAVVAALASVAVFDFFFLTPFYSFSIAEPSEVVDLAMFLFVALVTGNLAAALRREADRLRRRERDIHNLHLLSRRLALCSTDSDLVAAVQDYLTSHLGCQAFLIQAQQETNEASIDDPVVAGNRRVERSPRGDPVRGRDGARADRCRGRLCQREPAAAVGFPQERAHRQRLAPAALADRLDPRLDQRARRHPRVARRRPHPLAGRRHAPRGEAPR